MNEELRKTEKEKCKAVSLSKWKEAAIAANYIGSELFRLTHYTEALKFHREELSYNEMIPDELGIAIANRKLGECYTELGQYEKALSHIKIFLDITASLKNKIENQRAWATLGRTFYLKYVHEQETNENNNSCNETLNKAEQSYLNALKLTNDIRHDLSPKEYAEMKSRCLLNLALVYEWRGNITQCAKYIRIAVHLANKHNLIQDLHRCQSSLALVYQKHKLYKLALKSLDGAITSAERLKDKALLCEELLAKSIILINLKDFESARGYLKRAYKVHSPIQEDHEKSAKFLKICIGICNSQMELQDLDPSEYNIRKSFLEKIADGLSFLECYNLALDFYLETLKCMECGNFTMSQKAPIYFSIAMTYKDMGDNEKALEYLDMEMNCYKDEPMEQVKTLWKSAEVLQEMGDVKQLERNYCKAVTMAQGISNNRLLHNALVKLLSFYEQNKMTEKVEQLKSNLKDSILTDSILSDESEPEDQDPFEDIHLSELSDSGDTEMNVEKEGRSRATRRVKTRAPRKNSVGETPLHQACIRGNFTVLKRLVENGESLNTRDHYGWTPLHEACNYGYYEIVEYLIDKGALINDRGGPDCEGLTPLHDAAIVGHIDIMRLLISKGASVTACDDSGETPLQKLIRTRKENQDDLEPEDLQKCLEMEQELRQKMALAGQPAKDSDDEKVDTVHFNNFDFAEDCNVDCDNVRSSEKRARSSSLSSEQNSDDDIQSFINFSNGNQRHNWDGKEAKSEYQAVMSNLRQSAKSILLPCTSLSPTVNTKPALVCEDKNAHDWLINETNSVQRAKKKKKRKISQLPIRTSKSLYNYLTTEDNSGVENIKTLKNNNEECNVSHKTDKLESRISKNLTENDSLQTINKKEITTLSFCIKVRITDKLILIPVPEDSCSIGWLAEQASQRYQDLMGCRPHLTLMTKDGALLSKVDLIKTLFNNNEEISSTVDFWDEPSIDERYVQLCTKRGLKPVPSIQKRFINFDTSPEINFSNCSIIIPQTTIVFQVLQYYKNLQHLDISGTMLTDIVASEIISCFPSFVSLISLNMSCCCLTSGTLSNISQYLFQDISADAKLPCLKALILDYNIFQSNCVTDINIILQLSSLRILSLYSCNLIPTFFESTELIKTICNSSLEEFNIAGNTLSKQSLNNLVCSLPKKSLRKLDLSHTVQLGNSLTQQISNFLLADFPVLQEMSLEDCHLKDEDLLILTNRIRFCPQLKSLNISANSDLSSIAILNFLEMLLNINNALTDIILTGTCSWHMENVSILINILSRSSNVNCIMLDAISKSCQEKLTEFWKNHWGTKASCFVNRFCKLSII